jgi:hypothetical protein
MIARRKAHMRSPTICFGAALAMLASTGAAAQYGGNDGAVDQAQLGMYGAAQRDQTALQNRQDAETRAADNKAFYDSWDSFNQRAMQRAIMREREQKAALAACRRSAVGCTGQFAPAAGNPGVTFLSRELGKTPQEQAQVRALAAGYLGTYRQINGGLGLPANDIAGPMAYAFLISMRVHRGEAPTISRSLAQFVLGQARAMISNNGSIALLDNSNRQERAETLAINGVYLAAEFVDARRTNDVPRMNRAKKLAADVVRAITGVEPAAFAIKGNTVVATGVQSQAGTTTGDPVLNAARTTRFTWDPAATVNRNNSGLVNQFNQLVRQRGGDSSDLGWGAAGSIAIFYYLAQGVEMNNRQIAGTARTASQLFLESNEGARSTERDRQQAYERMAAEAMSLLAQIQSAQSSGYDQFSQGNIIRGAKESARNSLRAYLSPYSLSDFDLTPDGLVKRR